MNHAAPPGWWLQVHDLLPSTQDVAIHAARAGGAGHLAVLAREQSAGRGSHGRAWTAPTGNLNLSLVLEASSGPERTGMWSLLAGIALYEALISLLPELGGLTLKWPNDLMLGAGKLGGVLIDTAVGGAGLEWVVIGLGVNLERAPNIEGRETACLGGGVQPEELARSILRQIDTWRQQDDVALRVAWLARAHPLGTMLRVSSAEGQRIGAFAGLSVSGGLLLDDDIRPTMSAEIALHDASLAPCC